MTDNFNNAKLGDMFLVFLLFVAMSVIFPVSLAADLLQTMIRKG